MTPSERLLYRLRAMGLPLPSNARIQRTYAGAVQRSAGAWSWQVWPPEVGHPGIGSQYPVRELVADRMIASFQPSTNDWHVDPEFGEDAPDIGGPYLSRHGWRNVAEPVRYRRRPS